MVNFDPMRSNWYIQAPTHADTWCNIIVMIAVQVSIYVGTWCIIVAMVPIYQAMTYIDT